MNEKRVIKRTTLAEGDELPCHRENIIHTASAGEYAVRIFYVEG